jgi:hypothetical protein
MVGALALSVACTRKAAVTEVSGQCDEVFGGTVCTWAQMDGERVVALGATIPLSTIEGAPADAEMTWPPRAAGQLQLPEAAQRATGFTHLTVLWEPHGHPPGPFLTPHFDFHFYSIAPERRLEIDCSDVTKPAGLPEGYDLPDAVIPGIGTLVGICVPQMGMHSLLKSALSATTLFDATMVVGYYRGEVIFTEPMIAREHLLKKQDFTLPTPALPATDGVHHPTEFRAVYDAAGQAYHFEFSGFGT